MTNLLQLRETVARAIANADLDGPDPDDYWLHLADAAIAATGIERLLKREEALQKALRPFAKAGELFDGPPVDFDQCIYNPAAGSEYALSGNDLRKARTTLAETQEG